MTRAAPIAFDPARAVRRKLLLVVSQIETACRDLPRAGVDRLNVERELRAALEQTQRPASIDLTPGRLASFAESGILQSGVMR